MRRPLGPGSLLLPFCNPEKFLAERDLTRDPSGSFWVPGSVLEVLVLRVPEVSRRTPRKRDSSPRRFCFGGNDSESWTSTQRRTEPDPTQSQHQPLKRLIWATGRFPGWILRAPTGERSGLVSPWERSGSLREPYQGLSGGRPLDNGGPILKTPSQKAIKRKTLAHFSVDLPKLLWYTLSMKCPHCQRAHVKRCVNRLRRLSPSTPG